MPQSQNTARNRCRAGTVTLGGRSAGDHGLAEPLQNKGEVDSAGEIMFTANGLRCRETVDFLVNRESFMRIWWNWQTRYFEVVVP